MAKNVSIVMVLGFVILSAVGFWLLSDQSSSVTPLPDQGIMCTMDAMQCPDGSYVGRTGPSCEFVCPTLPEVSVTVQSTIDAHADVITVTTPLPLGLIQSGVLVTGQARGNWYFEGSFPIELLSSTGTVIARTIGTAQPDWMTEEFVPFTATLEFVSPYSEGVTDIEKTGTLILKKDNPSGLPEHDDALEIPIRFAP